VNKRKEKVFSFCCHSSEAVVMENGEDIFLTQKTFRESGSDADTDSIIDDIINMAKENFRFYLSLIR
jgi:hypothetical protein